MVNGLQSAKLDFPIFTRMEAMAEGRMFEVEPYLELLERFIALVWFT